MFHAAALSLAIGFCVLSLGLAAAGSEPKIKAHVVELTGGKAGGESKAFHASLPEAGF